MRFPLRQFCSPVSMVRGKCHDPGLLLRLHRSLPTWETVCVKNSGIFFNAFFKSHDSSFMTSMGIFFFPQMIHRVNLCIQFCPGREIEYLKSSSCFSFLGHALLPVVWSLQKVVHFVLSPSPISASAFCFFRLCGEPELDKVFGVAGPGDNLQAAGKGF